MKKNKFTIVLLIAAILFAAILLVGCNASCPGMGNCKWDAKKGEGSVCVDKELIDFYALNFKFFEEGEKLTDEEMNRYTKLLNDLCNVITSDSYGDIKCDC